MRGAAGDARPAWFEGLRYLTADEAPIPMVLKRTPEDFVVEEIPSITPGEAGEHLWIFVEKRLLSTPDLARRIGRAFDLTPKDIGWAGRKDARAVTRQWLSIRGGVPERLGEIEGEDLRVLRHARNERKLRVGALAGNRFELRLREIDAADRPRVECQLERLAGTGLPNYFGEQRFGFFGQTHELGRLLVQRRWRDYIHALVSPRHAVDSSAVTRLRDALASGERSAQRKLANLARELPRELDPLARQLARRPGDWKSAIRALERSTVRFHISALQARIFNRILALRLDSFDRPERGDLLQLHPSRSFFEVTAEEDLVSLRERAERFELSPTGPIPGWRSPLASEGPGEIERAVLAEEGLEAQIFHKVLPSLDVEGSRRSLRAPIGELRHSWEGADLSLSFLLPPGSYATVLVEELRKGI